MLERKIPAAFLTVLLLQFLLGCNDAKPSPLATPELAAGVAIEPLRASLAPRKFEYPLGNVVLNGTLEFDQATGSIDLDMVLLVRNAAKQIVVRYFYRQRTNSQGHELIQLNCGDRPMYAIEPYAGQRWIDAFGADAIGNHVAFVRIDGAAEEPEN